MCILGRLFPRCFGVWKGSDAGIVTDEDYGNISERIPLTGILKIHLSICSLQVLGIKNVMICSVRKWSISGYKDLRETENKFVYPICPVKESVFYYVLEDSIYEALL